MVDDPKSELTKYLARTVENTPEIDSASDFSSPQEFDYHTYIRLLGDADLFDLPCFRIESDTHANMKRAYLRKSREEAVTCMTGNAEQLIQTMGMGFKLPQKEK